MADCVLAQTSDDVTVATVCVLEYNSCACLAQRGVWAGWEMCHMGSLNPILEAANILPIYRRR